MGVSTWPGHGRLIVGAPILRVHLHVSWTPRNRSRKRGHARLWSPINSRKFGHPHAHYIARPLPSTNCAQLHTQTGHPDVPTLRPHLSTYAHNLTHDMVAQTTAGLTRFRQLWATTNFCGQSGTILGIHEIGSQRTLLDTQSRQSLGIHTIFVAVHELLWVAMRYYGRPRDFLDIHAIVLAVHEKLWALTRYIWASSVYRSALPRVTCVLPRYLHGHTRGFMGVHDGTHWTTTRNIMRIHTFQRTPTKLRAHPSHLPGRPRKI